MVNNNVVKIFTMEQQFPCGPQSSCCGPIGQSEQEVISLKKAIKNLGVNVEIYDIIQKAKCLQEHPQVLKLFNSFGPRIIPVITVGDEVVCVGQTEMGDIISAIQSKL